MANVRKSVPFKPEILERILAEKEMSLNELAAQIAEKNHVTKEAEMTTLRRYKRKREISLSALEDIGQILDVDPNVFRGKQIKYVNKFRENIVRPAQASDLTFQRYLERLEAENKQNTGKVIDTEALEQFLSDTPIYFQIQKMSEAQQKYYLHLLSIEMQRLMIVAATTEVELEYIEIQGKTTRVDERFRVISQPERTIPHPEDFYVSKKG